MRFAPLPHPAKYQKADPFPHCVIPGFLDIGAVRAINQEWPEVDGMRTAHHAYSVKHHTTELPDTAGVVVDYMTSPDFLSALSRLTGIAKLRADRRLSGAGLHHIERGGFLGVHVDFNATGNKIKKYGKVTIFRRVNALLYLNEDWDEAWGGHLKLYDNDQRERVAISPDAGTLALFTCSEQSWHGHPEPLQCPPDRQRRSLALYYYTLEQPEWFEASHSTIYR